MSGINPRNPEPIEAIAEGSGEGSAPAPEPAVAAAPEHCPTCGRRLGPEETLLKCGQCGQWLCAVGERALSCTGWIYCPLCRTMARAEWLEPALPAPA